MNVCPGIRIKCIFWGGKKNEVISELTRITPVNHFQWGTCSLHLETVFAEDWQRASSHGAATINWNSSARAAAAKKLRILKRGGGSATWIQGGYPRLVSPIHSTKCEVWSQHPLLFLSMVLTNGQRSFFVEDYDVSEVDVKLFWISFHPIRHLCDICTSLS